MLAINISRNDDIIEEHIIVGENMQPRHSIRGYIRNKSSFRFSVFFFNLFTRKLEHFYVQCLFTSRCPAIRLSENHAMYLHEFQ